MAYLYEHADGWLILIGSMGIAALVGASLTDSAIRGWHAWKELTHD